MFFSSWKAEDWYSTGFFFDLRRIDILGWITVMWRQSHALFDVQQHAWPLSSRYQ